jgi:hypothetical protein
VSWTLKDLPHTMHLYGLAPVSVCVVTFWVVVQCYSTYDFSHAAAKSVSSENDVWPDECCFTMRCSFFWYLLEEYSECNLTTQKPWFYWAQWFVL